jgi:putative oxidoreductase
MFKNIIRTRNDAGLAIVRLILGVVFFAHGSQKMLGWLGGYGFAGTMGYFTSLGIPYVFGVLAICAEFFGGIALVLGLLSRVAALGVLANMIVAMLLVHLPNGLFMNWGLAVKGTMAIGEGYEFHLLVIAMSLAILINGGGAASVDAALSPSRGSR